ncbi:MAG: ParB/RepB/Spo0J family partition protein [Erythrobacter sp.]|nr:ParB/RepB/Spo0J family partition protein [Erythrobacter sp.]
MSEEYEPENRPGSTPAERAYHRKRKLGRGLGALMGETRREEPVAPSVSSASPASASGNETTAQEPREGLRSIAVSAISPLPNQPRTHFDEDALAELAASIASRGVIQPIIVTPDGNNRYRLVAGERRWRAAQKARLHDIPAIVRELDTREITALALIENLQREDLNAVEEARAYNRLSENEGMTQAEIATMVEKSRSHVANMMRLLALPSDVLDLVESGRLSMGHARALIGNENALDIAQRAAREDLSVREVERLARGDAPRKAKREAAGANGASSGVDADLEAVQTHLEEFLGLQVRIKPDEPGKGTVSIRYRTLDQLDLVCQRLTGGEI